jgi:hypothetical protein
MHIACWIAKATNTIAFPWHQWLHECAAVLCYRYTACLLVTDFGVKVKQFVNKGHLVPDKLMISLIASELRLLENSNWLLDGK